jgi:hypothetical protein
MKKLLNKPWFVALLAVGALLFVSNAVYQGMKGPDYGSGGAPETAAPAEGESAAEGEPARLPARDALKALAISKGAVRDPFAQRAREEAVAASDKPSVPDAVDTVHLSALWTQNGATYTLINDRICQAGDEIGRLKIESATQEGVWISHWQGRDFLALGRDFTLKTPVQKVMATSPL